MIYLQYIVLVPISLILTAISIPLSIILPLFAIQKDGWLDNHSVCGRGPRLPTWLTWFDTPDNSLDGDATFERINGRSYWSKVKWLCRNPAYSFAIKYLNAPYTVIVSGDPTIKDNDNAKEGHCFIRVNGLFLFRAVVRIFNTNRCIYINIGWGIAGLADPNVKPTDTWQCTFVFSPRISGFR